MEDGLPIAQRVTGTTRVSEGSESEQRAADISSSVPTASSHRLRFSKATVAVGRAQYQYDNPQSFLRSPTALVPLQAVRAPEVPLRARGADAVCVAVECYSDALPSFTSRDYSLTFCRATGGSQPHDRHLVAAVPAVRSFAAEAIRPRLLGFEGGARKQTARRVCVSSSGAADCSCTPTVDPAADARTAGAGGRSSFC